MAGEANTAGANKMLDALTGRATQTAGVTYLALCTTAPTDALAGTEVTTAGTNGYSRQAVTWTAPAGDPSSTENSGALTFGPFTADLGNVTHVELYDAATAGSSVAYWSVDVAKNPAVDDSITVAAGAISITAD